MKFNIADPHTGAQKLMDVDDDKLLRFVLDKRISHEVSGSLFGEQFQDYTFKITGGIDKQGFPMKQGILVPDRVRLLLNESSGCYNMKKKGDRKRRSVRGCIVSRDISVLNLTVAKRGKEPIPDLTNRVLPRRLGPKRANNIRKLFNLEKSDDVRQFVVRREIASKKEGGKPKTKAPKIQRLITPDRLQRKRRRAALIRKQREHSKQQAAAYAALLAKRKQEKRAALMSKKSRNSARLSQRKSEKKQ
eukprot:CAMPEP_0117022720 /NCGR_PEP_ID=MMETSP0472-20121206/17044_1 /TAXON_ID=693140 ORGANISM="Tiarina fusus, Strain LIS" /NCGR_SAMPLE_ID=MMETSP0472 /ASSEMBLY_ACC=CAM_ASM_000603 /LENGTH=246 /DNA_ID=CAMNT_0004728659 /DNA_START=23 /DNA_END=763 /DNA_ORIENTATION=-